MGNQHRMLAEDAGGQVACRGRYQRLLNRVFLGGTLTRKLKIGIIDLVTNRPTRTLWARTMTANFASIMPQVIAACLWSGYERIWDPSGNGSRTGALYHDPNAYLKTQENSLQKIGINPEAG